MDLNELKCRIRNELQTRIPYDETSSPEAVERHARQVFDSWPKNMREMIDRASQDKLFHAVVQEITGYGPLQSLLSDPRVSEIMVLGPHAIYVESGGRKKLTAQQFSDETQLRLIVERMMGRSARRLDESVPFADFSLPDGSRVNVIIPPLAPDGTQVTIRKFSKSIKRVDDLEGFGTLSEPMAEYLVACIKARQSILFSGATGCGKTTTLAALSCHFDAQERIVVIEDTRELELNQKHVVHLLTRPPNIEGKGEITLRDLLRNTLRMRPNRILLGEIRGREAIEFLQALNSGHRGCCGVLHASSPTDAVSRLETLSLFAGLNLPVQEIRKQVASGLDLIVQQELYPDGVRRISHITEVQGMNGGEVKLLDIFRYTYSGVNANGELDGAFAAVAVPENCKALAQYGIRLNESMFTASAD